MKKYIVFYETKDGDSSSCLVEAEDKHSAEVEVMQEYWDYARTIDVIEE